MKFLAGALVFLLASGGFDAVILSNARNNPEAAASLIVEPNASIAKGILLQSLAHRWMGRHSHTDRDPESDIDPAHVPYNEIVANVKGRAQDGLGNLESDLAWWGGFIVLGILHAMMRPTADDTRS